MPLYLPEITMRMAWALALGTVIGIERQWHQKMAGLKTNALVATGAAGFLCAAALIPGGNPSQVCGQIVSGIGFLGAGVIMRDGMSVHGLNTAATLWCSAMVGALCGFGLWQAAFVAASLVLLANIALRPVANWLNTRVRTGNEIESRYTITLTCLPPDASRLRTVLMEKLRHHRLPADHLQSEAAPDRQRVCITTQLTTLHVADSAIETLLTELEESCPILTASWQVARASPEA